ncbi:hypothetical protein BDV38DRAFT_291652 [Aspergillus pseudotamarii]|uniref:Zn(2)-C6 fungal-type domain-containing protein n=1 Tax=Aspergillus pseudotamarii TaxID=132259 RepID=A0A5N6SW72_ASPPS|nr:uncharacterized protein BDV38DRAFT_291652 [Aspergillus pseudotamarii]KAE8138915.1 hypothetical protein BDV38DRAFT_291652 [Aspergillus pseudotamarii]
METSRPRFDRKRRDQKPRVLLSCTRCREKKLKCNRELPCANCLKRGQNAGCRYVAERPKHISPQERSSIDHRLQYLEQRLLNLERRRPPDDRSSSTPEEARIHARQQHDIYPRDPEMQTESEAEPGPDPVAGLLLYENNGTRFINPSHWQAIMNNATRELKKDRYDTHDGQETAAVHFSTECPVLLLAIPQIMSVTDLLAALPPRQTADSLVLRCLDSKEPSLISIHVPTFKQEYLEFWENPSGVSPSWLALLYGVLSCAVYIQHIMNPAVSECGLPGTFQKYRMNCAVALAKSNLVVPGRYKVEAAIMYLGIEYLQSNTLKSGISMLVGIVSRLAITMGYHRDPQPYQPQISSFEAEMRRRAWLVLLVTDSIVSRQTGLPRVIYPGVGDVTRPRNLLDEDFGPHTRALPPSRPEDQIDSNITYMLAMEQMLAVAGEVTNTASGFTLEPKRTLELNHQLERIRDQLPQAFRMLPPGTIVSDDATVIQKYGLEMIYQHARCVLHRQYLVTPRSEGQHQAFRWACVDAARQILALQSELFQGVLGKPRNRQRVWFGASRSISDCMTAAMVICLEVINQSQRSQYPHGTVRGELIQLLRTSYTSWKFSLRPSLETMKAADIVATMLRLLGAGGVDTPPTMPGDGEQQSISADNVDNVAKAAPTRIHEMLNGDFTLEMFDWALWDREMQDLHGLVSETGGI